MKYLIVILIGLISCNDGGSDPEFVKSKRTDPDESQQLHLDSVKPNEIIIGETKLGDSFRIKKIGGTSGWTYGVASWDKQCLTDSENIKIISNKTRKGRWYFDSKGRLVRYISSGKRKKAIEYKDTGSWLGSSATAMFPTDTMPVIFTAVNKINLQSLVVDDINAIHYDVYIGGYEKITPVAYKKRDSAWVVRDTLQTLRQLLQFIEREAFYDRYYIKKYILKDTIKSRQ